MKNVFEKSFQKIVLPFVLSLLLFQAVQAQKGRRAESKYPFRAGDGIQINVFPDTSSFLNRTFAIDGAGDVSFPIIGKINVLRLSKDDLAKLLKSTFAPYLRSTSMVINPVVRVSLLGGFQRPGLYYVDYNSTLWDVVRRTGGTIHEEGIDNMVWERNGDELSDELAPLFEKGISLKNMGFHSGDQLWTPTENRRLLQIVLQDIMPVVTFATTLVMTYYTYQLNILNAQNQARRY